jgi:hypothetical protein
MDDKAAVKWLNKWQKEIMGSGDKSIYVSWFELSPQAKGFMLMFRPHIDAEYDPELGEPEKTVFGDTIGDCVEKVLYFLSEAKAKELARLKRS